ncbi:MAG: tetratricopeptide repeat protein [Methanoregula sp.]|nr:tetratricopeptide repeat protein [Methanoregula sp.]
MIPSSRDEQKKEAFRLFEDGRYIESGQLCTIILESGKDSAIEVLAATNLYYMGKTDDAEVFFRDLEKKMPDSSYVHSYLAKVLEARGDEGAIAEYATAVHLDPSNQDALRSYAEYLLAHKDYRAALPVFKRLVQLGKKPADVKHLMQALLGIGEAHEALSTHAELGSGMAPGHEYIDALVNTGNFRAAAESANRIYKETRDPAVLRKYLSALSRYDVQASLVAYSNHIHNEPDCELLFDYALLLQANGNYTEALDAAQLLIECSRRPVYRLLECDLLAATAGIEGDGEKRALAAYELLIRDELGTKNDLDLLRTIISRYRQFLKTSVPTDEAIRRFLGIVSQDVNVASLLETALLYEDAGDAAEARSWYYRAYRAAFLTGGLSYAQFLDAHGEGRECEKVMLYILSNVKKSADLSRVAAVIVDRHSTMHRLKRLMEQLIVRLEARRATLDSEGLELLAMAFFIAGTNAHEEQDYAGCKYYCLSGMDVMPAHTRAISLEDFLSLIRTCKEKSVADRPIMNVPQVKKRAAASQPTQVITDQLGLTEQEAKILEFIRMHRTANEMELRKVLGTRRVVGIVNRLIQKAAAQGLLLIAKKGVGEEGEAYEYTGT